MNREDYRIEVAKIEHFHAIIPRDYDAQILFSAYSSPEAFVLPYLRKSYAFTGFYKDSIIGIAGLYPLEPGKADAWMFTGIDLPKHSRFVLKTIRNHLIQCEQTLNLKRIQAVVVDDFTAAHKFIKHLGFECETPDLPDGTKGGMKNYGPNGELYKLYARTRPW